MTTSTADALTAARLALRASSRKVDDAAETAAKWLTPAIRDRDADIVKANAQGMTRAAISVDTGLSAQRVGQIIAAHDAGVQRMPMGVNAIVRMTNDAHKTGGQAAS